MCGRFRWESQGATTLLFFIQPEGAELRAMHTLGLPICPTAHPWPDRGAAHRHRFSMTYPRRGKASSEMPIILATRWSLPLRLHPSFQISLLYPVPLAVEGIRLESRDPLERRRLNARVRLASGGASISTTVPHPRKIRPTSPSTRLRHRRTARRDGPARFGPARPAR